MHQIQEIWRTGRREVQATVVAMGCLLLGSACSSVHLESRTNPEAKLNTPVRSMVVVVMDERPDMRVGCENRFVKFLGDRGVRAATSYERLPLSDLKMSPEEIRNKLQTWNVEALVLTRPADRTSYGGRSRWGGPLAGSDMTWLDFSASQFGYSRTTGEIRTAVNVESRLYRLDNGVMTWISLTSTTIGETTDTLERLNVAIRKIVGQMAADKMIP